MITLKLFGWLTVKKAKQALEILEKIDLVNSYVIVTTTILHILISSQYVFRLQLY
jgi:hypothetical protein